MVVLFNMETNEENETSNPILKSCHLKHLNKVDLNIKTKNTVINMYYILHSLVHWVKS